MNRQRLRDALGRMPPLSMTWRVFSSCQAAQTREAALGYMRGGEGPAYTAWGLEKATARWASSTDSAS